MKWVSEFLAKGSFMISKCNRHHSVNVNSAFMQYKVQKQWNGTNPWVELQHIYEYKIKLP